MEPPTNPVKAARRRAAALLREGITPDWSIALIAVYDPARATRWGPREYARWRRLWALLRP